MEIQGLAELTVGRFEMVGKLHPAHIVVGSDGMHPRSIKDMPRGANEAFVALLNASGLLEYWVGW